MSEERAAQTIQAARRGSVARQEVTRRRESGSPSLAASELLTAELAKALSCDMQPTADGLQFACTRLDATDRRLRGGLKYAFATLPHLTAVDLSANRLRSLEGLEHLPALVSLTCCSNRLLGVLDFPAPTRGSRLKKADLRDNAISGAISLPPATDSRPRGLDAHGCLERLLLDSNQLRSLRGIGSAKHLVHFSASGNQLQDTAGTKSLYRLRTLNLSGNGLRQCAELSSLRTLSNLDLSSNELATLPDMRGLSNLTHLALANNPLPSLASITSAIGGLTSLRSLTLLAGNVALGQLPDPRLRALYVFPSLEQLDGKECTPEQIVAARNMHGDDATALLAIRAQLFGPDEVNTNERIQMPGLLHLYRQQYASAFIAGEQEHVPE